jgi:hypothetical protein
MGQNSDFFERRAVAGQPGILWSLFKGSHARGLPLSADVAPTLRSTPSTDGSHDPQLKRLVAKSTWLTAIQYLAEEVDDERTWQQYENELAAVLGIGGGSAAIRVCSPLSPFLL